MKPGDDLAAEIADRWALSGVRLLDRHVSYATRVVHRFTSDDGDFAAKVFEGLDSSEPAESVGVLLAVRGAGFVHAPAVRLTRSGATVGVTSGGPTVVMEDIPIGLSGHVEPATWTEIGAAVASLNSYRCDRLFTVPVGAALDHQITRSPTDEYATGIVPLVRRLEHLASLPAEGVVHGEANPSNAARRDNGELALLDWDQAGMGPRALDYGYPLVTCFVSESLTVDELGIRSFYDGYRSRGGGVDARLAMDAALFHALRYMWFANTPARWERIQFALRCESDLTDLIG